MEMEIVFVGGFLLELILLLLAGCCWSNCFCCWRIIVIGIGVVVGGVVSEALLLMAF